MICDTTLPNLYCAPSVKFLYIITIWFELMRPCTCWVMEAEGGPPEAGDGREMAHPGGTAKGSRAEN